MLDHLTECIRKAVRHTQFRNVYGEHFDSTVMGELYSRKTKRVYSLSNTDCICTRESELTNLVSELEPLMTRYRSAETRAVGNGFYMMMGSIASPRLPTIEDYAKILVLAAARIGTEQVVSLFAGWLEGHPVQVWQCTLLKGAITDEQMSPVDGLCLKTLPKNGDEFPRSLYVQIDSHDIQHEQYAQRAMLLFEHHIGPVLYTPDDKIDKGIQLLQRPSVHNKELSSISIESLCRALSLETNNPIEWFMQWWDYGIVDSFFLNPGHSSIRREIGNLSSCSVSEEQLGRSLEIHEWLGRFNKLDLAIARWRRSKRAISKEEQLVELRIALESVLLSDDRGNVGEKRHRLAIRGAWFLGRTFEERKAHFRTLRKTYDLASAVIHAGSLENEDPGTLTRVISESQEICRKTILRIAQARSLPDWSEVVLGKVSIG